MCIYDENINIFFLIIYNALLMCKLGVFIFLDEIDMLIFCYRNEFKFVLSDLCINNI